MAADTDLVASKAAALRLAQQMGCSGAHQHPDGKWMPCATMEEYEELVKKDKKNTVRVVEQRRRYRNSKGKNKRDWEPLAERGVTSIDTIAGGGLVGGSVKAAPWAPDDEDPDVFTTPRLARRRSRQLGCIGISRRVSRNGNVVWTPCSNMTDYAKRTGSTAFGRNHQRRQAQRRLERAVSREVRRQLRRKKSLMEELYEGKALGRKLNRARVAATTPFNRDARDADMDMIVQEGTVWERPATPRVPGLRSRRGIAAQVDPAVVPEDPVGESREKLDHLMDLAGYAQMQKLRRANPDVPDDKLYRLAREVDLGEGRSGTWSWGNDSKIPAEMENLPDETLDRITREALAEFDRRKEVERLRLEKDPVTGHPLRVEGLTDREIKAQIGLQQMDRDRLEQGLPSRYRRPFYDSDYLNRLIAERTAREERGDWTDPDLPSGFASTRTGRRRAERRADRLQRRRDLRTERRDRRTFERDMEEMPDAPITDNDLDLMYEYYAFEEAVGLKSIRGFKLTPEEQRDLSEADKAAKYRKASLDAVNEEHRGKPVQQIHWVFGAPGSGKTTRTDRGELGVPSLSEAVHTNPDDYKEFHKLWNFGEGSFDSHQFSRTESEKTVRAALDEGIDVVVQGTGKDGRLLGDTIYERGDYRNGRRGDRVSVMHFLYVSDLERSRRIADRRSGQRRRYGAKPEDASQVRDQVVKYIEEGRVDEAHIYDNGNTIDTPPSLVASFKDGNLVIYDEEKFEEIFDPTDIDGDQATHHGKIANLPRVSATSHSDDPRRGKTYAERLREEGENPGGFRKWDTERREKSIRERSKREAHERSKRETRERSKSEAHEQAEYRGRHQAPTKSAEGGDTLDDLSNRLPLQAGENNTHRIRFYGSGTSDPEYARANDEMLEALDSAAENPDKIITAYRAVPSGKIMTDADLRYLRRAQPGITTTPEDLAAHRAKRQINPGDWVTPSPTYAAIHGEGPMRGDYEIAEMEVRAGDLVSEGNSLYEFGYDPGSPPDPDPRDHPSWFDYEDFDDPNYYGDEDAYGDEDGFKSRRGGDPRVQKVARLESSEWNKYYGEETRKVADALGIDVTDPRYPHPGAVATLYDYGREESDVELVPIEFFDDMPGNIGAAASNDGNGDAYALAGEIREFESDPDVAILTEMTQTELVKSVGRVGILSPLIGHYDYETGDLVLGEGNHRLAAAREVGMTVVPIRFTQLRGQDVRAGARKQIQTLSKNKHGPVLPNGNQLSISFKPSDIGIPTHDLHETPEFEKLKQLRKGRNSAIMENIDRRNELKKRATQEALDSGSTREEAHAAGKEAWGSEKDRWLSSPEEPEEGESLQNAYRRHLKLKGIQTDGEQAFEEQYGYEMRSGDGDCYSAAYSAAAELAEKGVDVDGDPIENIRVVVGSPVFPKVGERSGHAWVEYEVVKPPPPVMSSADRDKAKEQILELVETMDLPPKQKQSTIDSFTDAIDRANEANASMPARNVTMVRDYSNVKDTEGELLEAKRPDMTRDSYYEAGELGEADISGRFTPAEYEETQVSLFGDEFYDGTATFLTREQVDQHLDDMGIDGLASKRTDAEDSEEEQIYQQGMEALTSIFNEAELHQSNDDIDALTNALFSTPMGYFGNLKPLSPETLDAVRELVEERDPEFLEELAEARHVRTTVNGFRRLVHSGLDSGVGDHGPDIVRNAWDMNKATTPGTPITLYHGGPIDLTGDVEYEVSRNDSGQWGPGIYTTSSAFPAIKGWANPWERTWVEGESGYPEPGPIKTVPKHLHTTKWKGENPPQILDAEESLPDDVLDEVVLPTLHGLGEEVAHAIVTGDGRWRQAYAWIGEDLDELVEDIARKRDGLNGGRDALTGRETLLWIQTFLQTNEMGPEQGGKGWNEEGFLPSERIQHIRKQINARIKDLGYDVIKSHEKGIRDMDRTDYLFLDPDMVEFVDVAPMESLGGFGNMGSVEMNKIVHARKKDRKTLEEAS
jgi:hypothetical protein